MNIGQLKAAMADLDDSTQRHNFHPETDGRGPQFIVARFVDQYKEEP